MTWHANGDTDLPLADRDREWDGDGAEARLFKWAGWEDDPQPAKARRGFFAYNDDGPTKKSAYKLPFADVIGGRLKAVPHGIFAAAAVLDGARGGVNLPEAVIEACKKEVEVFYHKLGERAPWEEARKPAGA